MSEVLDKIDYNLTRIEDRLLSEFLKIQKADNPAGYGELSQALKTQIREALVKLRHLLDHSGTGRLELTTDYHEVLRARMYILDRLLDRKVPNYCLRSVPGFGGASGGPRDSARGSESSGSRGPAATITKRVLVDRDQSNRSFLNFFRGQFGGQKTGQHNIRVDSVEPGSKEIYADVGIYAAAQQLASLESSIVDYQERVEAGEDPEADTGGYQQAMGKATFDSRDLSMSQQIKLRDIARSPEEIRKKLEARRLAAGGKASFTSADLTAAPETSSEDEAQKPAREPKAEEARERAVFVARDLSSNSTDRKR